MQNRRNDSYVLFQPQGWNPDFSTPLGSGLEKLKQKQGFLFHDDDLLIVSAAIVLELASSGRPKLGFPRDGTSRDKNISLSRCLFVLVQGQEQKSQDKLLCPGTFRTKWISINLIALKKIQKKMTRFSALERHFLF